MWKADFSFLQNHAAKGVFSSERVEIEFSRKVAQGMSRA